MNKEIYKKMYRYDANKNEYLLEMAINNFYEIFHDWDASAMRKKDLDPDMVDYMIEAVIELPPKANIGIIFRIRQNHHDKLLEEIAKTALQNYFSFRMFLNQRRMYRFLKMAIGYLILGFCFIFSANQFETFFDTISLNVLTEGLFIGGWVFVWESVSLLFFRTRAIRMESKRFQKILNANIYYKYQGIEKH